MLGELELRLGRRRLPLGSARVEALVAYLPVHRDAPQPRERIAFVLRPDSTEAAGTDQRAPNAAHAAPRAPDADRCRDVTQRTLRWRPDAPASLDLAAFEDAIARR